MANHFKVSEFIIDRQLKEIPVHVADKVVQYHLPILNGIRERLGVPVIISKRSGYRPVEWEKARGRSGTSQHCFRGKGAVDVRSNRKFDRLLGLLIESEYTRVCYYTHSHFIHCDFKPVPRKVYFEAGADNVWCYKYFRDIGMSTN